ncbi:MAG: protein adenylyltransferase SelO [Paracoccaceae bacterium]
MNMRIPFDNSYARLPARFFARQAPTAVPRPELIAFNAELAAELGLDAQAMNSKTGAEIFAGNRIPEGAEPIAQAYAAHQFGNWVPQLGDGRAILLGEVIGAQGRRDIQLKGAGRTPFSRSGDGRAWLGPVLREYLVSEAMHRLHIPTTRALAATRSGAPVQRETVLPGAVLTRVAASHIRVGTFQFFAARGDVEALEALTNHVIARHYPDVKSPMELLHAVINAQAALIAKWMSVGFIHGVMNTDNMAVSGETIDYGPCAFIDSYHPDTLYSSIDRQGRYAYSNQPAIGAWNLAQFASCLIPLMGDEAAAVADATAAVHGFMDVYERHWMAAFRAKLGLDGEAAGDRDLIESLLAIMATGAADFTNTFRTLGQDSGRDQFVDPAVIDAWLPAWQERRAPNYAALMAAANPAIIPRNHRIQQVIEASVAGDDAPFHRLNAALKTPFDLAQADEDLARPPLEGEQVLQTFCGT